MTSRAPLKDAVRFRRIVVICALIPFAVLQTFYSVLPLFGMPYGRIWVPEDLGGSILQTFLALLLLPCIAASLYAITGSASYFFAPSSLSTAQQNRAISLSYYACAPMAYLPLAIVAWCLFLAAAAFLEIHGNRVLAGVFMIVVLAIMVIYPLIIFRTPLVLLRAVTHCGVKRQALMGALMPLIWLMNIILFVGVIYVAAALIGGIVLSLLY